MKPALVFVYNADSGLFNALTDLAHKAISPATYSCNLCALTYSGVSMRKEWKEFLEGLGRPLEFLHRDELKKNFSIQDVPLPAVFVRQGDRLDLRIDADTLNACRTLSDLKSLIADLGT